MEARIHFPPEQDTFYSTLRNRVNDYFIINRTSKFANSAFYLKAFFLLICHLVLYFTFIFSENQSLALICMILLGPTSILVGINVAHDGAHGAISRSRFVNFLFLSLLDILGANSYMWKRRHVFSHHIFPNILGHDSDLKQNPMIRIFPNDELRSYHRYQHLYAPFLYLLYTMHWLLFRDFMDFNGSDKTSQQKKAFPAQEILKLIFFKVFYITYILILPVFFSSLPLFSVLVGYFFMNFAASLLITLALIPSHVAETSSFPEPDNNGKMPYSWSHHQVHTVIDFATENPLLNFFFGGFNHHLSHHLFPGICHVHYSSITKIVKETVHEFGMQYKHEDSFINAYLAHYKLLKNNGQVKLNQAGL